MRTYHRTTQMEYGLASWEPGMPPSPHATWIRPCKSAIHVGFKDRKLIQTEWKSSQNSTLTSSSTHRSRRNPTYWQRHRCYQNPGYMVSHQSLVSRCVLIYLYCHIVQRRLRRAMHTSRSIPPSVLLDYVSDQTCRKNRMRSLDLLYDAEDENDENVCHTLSFAAIFTCQAHMHHRHTCETNVIKVTWSTCEFTLNSHWIHIEIACKVLSISTSAHRYRLDHRLSWQVVKFQHPSIYVTFHPRFHLHTTLNRVNVNGESGRARSLLRIRIRSHNKY